MSRTVFCTGALGPPARHPQSHGIIIVENRMARLIEACWEFHCPECGFGHHELGRLAADHEIYCIVCDHESGRLVKLHRWLPDVASADDMPPQARLRAERED